MATFILTTGNPDVDRALLSILTSVIGAWLLRKMRPKAKLRYFTPHAFIFNIPSSTAGNPPTVIHTATLRVENWGAEKAENVEIYHRFRPEQFVIWPAVAFEQTNTPEGYHLIRIKMLAPQEGASIEMISLGQLPELLRIRSEAGDARQAMVEVQQFFPTWAKAIASGLIFIGFTTTIYMGLTLIGVFLR